MANLKKTEKWFLRPIIAECSVPIHTGFYCSCVLFTYPLLEMMHEDLDVLSLNFPHVLRNVSIYKHELNNS